MEDRLKKAYLIGVDLGTSGTKAALYRTDGTLVAEAGVEVPIYYPRPGVVAGFGPRSHEGSRRTRSAKSTKPERASFVSFALRALRPTSLLRDPNT
jgi:molecular chaperone DnaK (HSP70)